MRARRARFATVLFTDIVGSTTIATELGDRAWKELVARHDQLVREQVRRFGGREQDSAGDGFFVGFEDQAAAIRCACAVADGVQDLGLQVRCGLNVGTAENLGGKIGGLMVVTAARIMAVAEPNEVLVSRVLHDLVPGAGLAFGDPRTVSLKGIEGVTEVFPVVAVDGGARAAPLSADEAAGVRRSFEPPPFHERRSARLAVLAAIALTILAVAAFTMLRKPEPVIEVEPQSLLQVDPATGDLLGDVAVEGVLSPPAAVPTHEIWLCEN